MYVYTYKTNNIVKAMSICPKASSGFLLEPSFCLSPPPPATANTDLLPLTAVGWRLPRIHVTRVTLCAFSGGGGLRLCTRCGALRPVRAAHVHT